MSLKYLKSTHGSGKVTRRLSATSTEQGDLEYRQRALSAFVSNGAELFFMIVIAALLLYYVEIARQEVIEILFILFIVRRGMNYALQAQNSFQGFLRYVGSARNFRELIRELEDNEERTAPEGRAPDFDRPIALDGVTFGYGDAAPALDALSLEIPPRSTVAFVGASGAGKSTLATLLTGILPPTAGAVARGRHALLRAGPGGVAAADRLRDAGERHLQRLCAKQHHAVGRRRPGRGRCDAGGGRGGQHRRVHRVPSRRLRHRARRERPETSPAGSGSA